MRAGYAIRAEKALAHEYAVPCADCGHPQGGHKELLAITYGMVDGQISEVPNPVYQPLHFHCSHEGCSCVVKACP